MPATVGVICASDASLRNLADPLRLVTDRQILRLREGVSGGWVKRGEVLAREVTGASMSSWGSSAG